MLYYETLILSRPDAADDELDGVLKGFEKIIQSGKGAITATDKWGKLHLAYPIKKDDYGVYTLLRYELPESSVCTVLADITSFFKVACSESVFRHTTTRNKSGAVGYVYKRPEPSEALRGGLDKIEGFLGGTTHDLSTADADEVH